MKKLLLTAALLPLLHGSLQAITITIDAEVLKDAGGNPLPLTSLIVLTAATTGTFSGPTTNNFVSGTETVLGMLDLSGGFATPGVFSDFVSDLTLSGDWNEGDPLRLYWYPTLTLGAIEPGFGTSYGTYSDPLGLYGSTPWLTPAEGDTVSLQLFTEDASFLSVGGDVPAQAGLALNEVPDHGKSIGLLGLAFGVIGLAHRRFGRVEDCRQS